MKAINSSKHRALAAALRQLAELAGEAPESGVSPTAIREGLLALSGTYERYKMLLTELAEVIAEYETLHQHLKVNVLGANLRKLHRQCQPAGAGYYLLRELMLEAKAV